MINFLLFAAIFLAIVFGVCALIFAAERVRLAIICLICVVIAVVAIALGAKLPMG